MEKLKGLSIGPVALLVVLALLTYLVVNRKGVTADEAEGDAVRTVVKLEHSIDRDDFSAVAFLVLVALFAFVTWTTLRGHKGEDKATPPVSESSASGTTPPGTAPVGHAPPTVPPSPQG
jgi:hypothetical protein